MSADAKHSADRPSLDEQMRQEARDREELRKLLKGAEPKSSRWLVVRQIHTGGEVVEHQVSRHRFERLAYWRAYRLTRSHPNETGCHYTVRRAAA